MGLVPHQGSKVEDGDIPDRSPLTETPSARFDKQESLQATHELIAANLAGGVLNAAGPRAGKH